MKGGSGGPRTPKRGPLMPSVPPEAPNFSPNIRGVGHSFLRRATAPPPLVPAWDIQSSRWRGQNSPLQQQQQWGKPSPPGLSPRRHNPHPHQQRRGFRTPVNIPAVVPQGHMNGAGWRSNGTGFEMEQQDQGWHPMAKSPENSPFTPPPWGVEGRPFGHYDMGGLPPGEDGLAYADRVATQVYNEMLAGKKGVSTAKVAQATLAALGIPAFEAVGIMFQDIATLRKLTTLESRVNAFIHCYVAGRKIATLYDLSVDLAREEGVKTFEDLGLGSLLCHELVVHYFSPPAGAEIHQITAGTVIGHLSDCIGNQPKEVKLQVESFLSFLAKQQFLSTPQHLCVRIQSLGMHIGLIRRSKKAEKDQIGFWESRAKAEFDKNKKQTVMTHIEEFFEAEKEKEASMAKRKRKRVSSENSGDSDGDTGDNSQVDGILKGLVDNRRKLKLEDTSSATLLSPVSSCPYPSATEERVRALKKWEMQKFVANSKKEDFYLSSLELQEFVTLLKDACQNRSVHEVLMKMIEMSRKFKGTKKRSGKSKIFKAYPAVGLLNVAVLSVKAGFWDSMCHNFMGAGDEAGGSFKENIRSVQITTPIDVGTSKQNSPCQTPESPGLEDVVAAVSEHYEQILKPQNVDSCQNQLRAWWSLLHWVQECEEWVGAKYSVGAFTLLGFGKFSQFLEQNLELLPSSVTSIISKKFRSRKLVMKIPKERLFSFVAQALPTASENGSSVQEHISGLICRQFKVSSVEELCGSSLEILLETTKEEACTLAPANHVLFLEPLVALGKTKGNGALGQIKESSPQIEVFVVTSDTRVGVLGSMTSADAAKCLMKAPFLVDLSQWSQWPSVFAPTLGPLLDWFEREGFKWGLHALVTCEGTLLRIDDKATTDSFLLAAAKGSGDQMAAVLMSLIALYGGTTATPTALLKSHASKGLDILLDSSASGWTSHSPSRVPAVSTKRKLSQRQGGDLVKQPHSVRDGKQRTRVGLAASGNRILQPEANLRETVAGKIGNQSFVATECILECLSCVIPEFRTFAAEILLPALSPLVAGTPALLLSTCLTLQQKSSLHGLGFSLGIPEWITDYTTSTFGPTQASAPRDMSGSQDMEVDKANQAQLEKEESNEAPVAHLDKKIEARHTEVPTNDIPTTIETVLFQTSPQHQDTDGSDRSGQIFGSGGYEDRTKDALLEMASIEAEASIVIEEIRQHEFGLGQDIQGKESDLLARQHARMGRALHRLSSDLYSQDSHFVLELIQNADDNAYYRGVEPAIAFFIQEGRIVVLNNETGFTAANVRALCDVGNSTKAGMNTGYIGHKGIGFKSVFRVTDAPEIHSNGFHLKFDISEGDLGFILPTSIPSTSAGDSNADIMALMSENGISKRLLESWNTRINLPFKASLQKGTGLSILSSKFSDLHPSLLLFLHRLRSIAVRNDLTGSMVVMRREDKGDDLVEVSHNTGTATWMVVRQQLTAGVHRPGITETEVALAFQLNELSLGTYEAYCEQQQVFAFLPLRSYGLRFILQGDFKVPSSREEVDRDSNWNQWLRSEIPNVFLKSAKAFQKTLFPGSPGKAVSSFMSFVPMEGEVLGFFSPLPRMILSSLRGSPCLPVEGGGWAMPCVLLRGWSNSTRELLPDSFLNEHLGLRYIDKDVTITDVLAMKLGVQQFGAGTLIAVMKSVCQNKKGLMSLGIKWVQAWLLALHKCFVSDQKPNHLGIYEDKYSSVRLELQSLPYIPLLNGMFTSLSDGPVWFAGELLENGLGVNFALSDSRLLSSELRTIHPGLLSLQNECGFLEEFAGGSLSLLNVGHLEKSPVEKIVSILQGLGVSKLSPHELLKSHVLPAMAKDDCLLKDELLVVEYLGFVISHLESNCVICSSGEFNVKAELQKCAVILTSDGLVRAGQGPVHFGAALGNNISDIKMILEGTHVPWIEVSPHYLQLQARGCELAQLRNFFKEMGVTDFVKVVRTEWKISDKSSSVWKSCVWEDGAVSEGGWIVQDWHSPELAQILMNTGGDAGPVEESFSGKRCKRILAALDHTWDDYYHQYCEASYSPLTGSMTGAQNATVSSFLLLLQQCSWVMSCLDGKLHAPIELLRSCDAVKSILGSNAPYMVTQIQSAKLLEALGLRTQVLVDDALQLLRYWSQEKGLFEASVEQMTRLYHFLWENFPSHKEDILRMFRFEESIFVPLHWNKNEQELQKGRFYSVECVCWMDPTDTLDILTFDQKTRLCIPVAALSGIYHSLYDFFVNACLVQEMPSFDGYLELLKKVAAEQPPRALLGHVMDVFMVWLLEVSRGNVKLLEIQRWRRRLEEAQSCIFATNQDKWVSLNGRTGLVCICDDKKLGEEFEEFYGGIHFILMTDDDLRQTFGRRGGSPRTYDSLSLQPLVEALGIPKLSEVVEREVIKNGLRDGRKIEALVDWILPFTQRYLKHHHAEQYRYLEEIRITETLRRLQFVAVDQLYFQYYLRNSVIRSNKRTHCTCILEGNTLHVVEDSVQDYCNIYAELSRLFFGGKANLLVANFLHLITLMASSGKSKHEVEVFIQSQGIQPIIEGEHLWTLGTRVRENYHLVGWPPKTWTPPTRREMLPGHNGYSSGVPVLTNTPNQVSSWRGNDTIEKSTTTSDNTSWDDSSRAMVEESNANGSRLFFNDVKYMPSSQKPSYAALTDANGKIHDAKALQFQEAECPTPSQSLQGGWIATEANSQAMDVQEVGLDGDYLMTGESASENRALTNFQGRDSLGAHPVNDQQRETGRSGEALVYQHLSSHYGHTQVRWLNQESESGAAYDIVVIKESGKKEFVEVKATRSVGKDWFEISPKEWDFAKSHAESFTIMRVFLGATSQQVRFLRLPNPVKLAQDHVLQLALLLPAVQDNNALKN